MYIIIIIICFVCLQIKTTVSTARVKTVVDASICQINTFVGAEVFILTRSVRQVSTMSAWLTRSVRHVSAMGVMLFTQC